MVKATVFRRIVRPMTVGSPPNRRFQKLYDSTASGAHCPCSTAGENPCTEKRPDTEHSEVRRRHRFADDPLGAITIVKAQAIGAHPDDVAEHAGLAEPIDEVRGHRREQNK